MAKSYKLAQFKVLCQMCILNNHNQVVNKNDPNAVRSVIVIMNMNTIHQYQYN